MSVTVYHLKTCDTCRKAIKALEAVGHKLSLVDVRADGVSAEHLRSWVEQWGWETVLNRRSTTWRNLEDADKADIDNSKAVALMGSHPTLIKRPVVVSDDQSTIGWAKDAQAVWL